MTAPRPVAPGRPFRAAHGIPVYDVAAQVGGKRGRWPKCRPRSPALPLGASLRRDPATITTVVLHQTATELPPSDGLVERYGAGLGAAMRAARTAYHVLGGPFGICVAKPLDVYANHGGRLNRLSLGYAVVGRFPGLMDDPATAPREDLATLWGWRENPATELTAERLHIAREGLALLVEEGRRQEMPLDTVLAHRQGSSNRRADPGEELWQLLVVDFAVPVLGLRVAPSYAVACGRAIPVAWDPRGKGLY